MSLSVLGSLLESAPQYRSILDEVGRPRANAKVQVLANATPFVLAALVRSLDAPALVVTPRPEQARRMYEQISLWSDPAATVLHFPENESLPFERLVSDADTTRQRLEVLSVLAGAEEWPPLVVASASALTQKTIDPDRFRSGSHTLRRGDTVDMEELLERWRRMGYRFEPVVYAVGDASRRGGILDIYPAGSDAPARIELWGNEVDSIRLFDPETQRSTEVVDAVSVGPAGETLPGLADPGAVGRLAALMDFANCTEASRERLLHEMELLAGGHEIEELEFYAGLLSTGLLLDYLPEETLLVMAGPYEIAEAAWEEEERAHGLRRTKESRGDLPTNFPSSQVGWREVEERPRRLHAQAGGASLGGGGADVRRRPRAADLLPAGLSRQARQLRGGGGRADDGGARRRRRHVPR